MFDAPPQILASIAQGTLTIAGQSLSGIVEQVTLPETVTLTNTDWLGSNVTPSKTPCMHKMFIKVGSSNVVKIELDDSNESTTDVEFKMNEGVALNAGAGYTFDLPLVDGQSYNIQFETTSASAYVHIIEYPNFTA
jgi:hypothetical protein